MFIELLQQHYKEILGAFAAFLAIYGIVPYIRDAYHQKIKPHLFSWLIWTFLTGVAWAGQWVGNAGPGAWTTFITTLLSLAVVILAMRFGEKNITLSDWVMFLAGVAAIPVWLVTKDPVYAVIIVTFVDVMAFGPTIRKSWHKPKEEGASLYKVNIARHIISVLALTQFTITTALFPLAVCFMNIVLLAVIYRKKFFQPVR